MRGSIGAGASMTEAVHLRVRVAADYAGTRLDRFLASRDEVGSRAAAERLLAEGAVLVDGVARPKSHRLEGGESVEFSQPAAQGGLVAERIDVPTAFEDDHLLVVDKPAGLVVHPGAGRATGTLAHALVGRAHGGDEETRPGIVHRLDRDTSGLLVVAKSQAAYEGLQRSIRGRDVEREYAALVRGRPRSRRGRIDAPIGRDRTDPTRHSLDTETPREAVTHFEVQELLARHSLLTVRLETGRTHQIRVHLAAIGLPVAGDHVYGARGELGLERQFLHAARLAFVHPVTGARVDVRSALPPDLGEALARARRAGA